MAPPWRSEWSELSRGEARVAGPTWGRVGGTVPADWACDDGWLAVCAVFVQRLLRSLGCWM